MIERQESAPCLLNLKSQICNRQFSLRLVGYLAARPAPRAASAALARGWTAALAVHAGGRSALATDRGGVGRDRGLVAHPADREAVAGFFLRDAENNVLPLRVDLQGQLAEDQPLLQGEVAFEFALLGALHRVVHD